MTLTRPNRSRARWRRTFAITTTLGLLAAAGCAAADAPGTTASPGDAEAGDDTAPLTAWLIPETVESEADGAAPEAEGSRRSTDPGRGGARFGLDGFLDEIDLTGGDFVVLEGVPEAREPTPVAIHVTSVEVRTFGGRSFVAVSVAGENAGPDLIAGLFPLEPSPAAAPAATGHGAIGLWVTGTPFRNWSNGGSFRGEGVWRGVAPGAVGDDGFSCAGPAADALLPHAYPECLALHLGDDSARHSPVYGFAADGYPVHGPWADLELPARSSWRLRDYETAGSATGCGEPGRRTCLLADPLDPAAGTAPAPAPGPDVADVAAGAFFEDYWFDMGLDDGSPHALDAFNGHDHDDAGYHYHITRIQNGDGSFTDVFPYIIGPWFRGELHPGALNPGGPRLAEGAATSRADKPGEPDEPDESDQTNELDEPGVPDPAARPPALCIPRIEPCD